MNQNIFMTFSAISIIITVMAVCMATGTETAMKVHELPALENGATMDEVFEVIRMIFFTSEVINLLPALENSGLFEPLDLVKK